jgi:cytoskeletal protein RodZ
MDDLGFLLYIVFIVVILANNVFKRYMARKRQKEQQTLQRQRQQTQSAHEQHTQPTPAGRLLPAASHREIRKPVFGGKSSPRLVSHPPLPANAHAENAKGQHKILKNRASARAAIIAMTVLGPCRSASPYGDDALTPRSTRPD